MYHYVIMCHHVPSCGCTIIWYCTRSLWIGQPDAWYLGISLNDVIGLPQVISQYLESLYCSMDSRTTSSSCFQKQCKQVAHPKTYGSTIMHHTSLYMECVPFAFYFPTWVETMSCIAHQTRVKSGEIL